MDLRLGGDLVVRRLGFGAMRLPTAGFRGLPRDAELGRRVLRRALELGVNHIDTADFYRSGDGSVRANVLIREALHPYPAGLVIATKVGPVFGRGAPRTAKPDELRGLVEDNLKSLGVERLDLVYLRIGLMEGVPHGESIAARFEALAKLREEGLIRHLGLSNVDVAHVEEARAVAPVVAVQNHDGDDDAVHALCAGHGIAFAPFFPLGGGHDDEDADDHAAVDVVAARHKATRSQIALARLLARSPVTLAIPGTGSLAHLEENVAAGSIVLTAQDRADLG